MAAGAPMDYIAFSLRLVSRVAPTLAFTDIRPVDREGDATGLV